MKGDNEGSEAEDGDANSSKWDFKMLQQAFAKAGTNYNLMYNQMKDIIIKTLLSVEPTIQS
jgi:hypothetical protein